jgi:ribosome-binding factor A
LGNRNYRQNQSRRKYHSSSPYGDDGIDPRYWSALDRERSAEHRKAWQLCRQVREVLIYELHGDGCNDTLSSLQVISVTPAPDTANLLVIVSCDLPVGSFSPDAVLALLAAQVGRLRSEVARSIHRRKTPRLTFQVIAAVDCQPD